VLNTFCVKLRETLADDLRRLWDLLSDDRRKPLNDLRTKPIRLLRNERLLDVPIRDLRDRDDFLTEERDLFRNPPRVRRRMIKEYVIDQTIMTYEK